MKLGRGKVKCRFGGGGKSVARGGDGGERLGELRIGSERRESARDERDSPPVVKVLSCRGRR